jgi:hypothetical protein
MRSPRAQGLRTLQHQSLPRAVCQAIDTEVWFRGLLLEGAESASADRRWATKDQVYDEALGWYLARRPASPAPELRVSGVPVQDLTFWVDSRLLARARQLAERRTIKLAHLIEQALSDYVQQHIPASFLEFRRDTQQQAARLYTRLGRAGPGRRPRRRD